MKRCLVVGLSRQPVVVLAPECPEQSVRIVGQRYRASESGEFTGLYDWLRGSKGQVLGVRYWPFETTAFLCNILADLPYVVIADDRAYMEIYFTAERAIDAERSRDQDFGTSKVFTVDGAAWALAFDTVALNALELHSLAALTPSTERAAVLDTL